MTTDLTERIARWIAPIFYGEPIDDYEFDLLPLVMRNRFLCIAREIAPLVKTLQFWGKPIAGVGVDTPQQRSPWKCLVCGVSDFQQKNIVHDPSCWVPALEPWLEEEK